MPASEEEPKSKGHSLRGSYSGAPLAAQKVEKRDSQLELPTPGFEIKPLPVADGRESQSSARKKVYKDEDDYFNQDVLNEGTEPVSAEPAPDEQDQVLKELSDLNRAGQAQVLRNQVDMERGYSLPMDSEEAASPTKSIVKSAKSIATRHS